MNFPTNSKEITVNFIVGTGRTGSTLLASMLNMHPEVVSVSEETFVYTLFVKYTNVKNWNSETIQNYCNDFFLFSEGKLEPQFGSKSDLENILEKNKSGLDTETAIKLTHLCFLPEKDKAKVTTLVDKELVFHTVLEELAAMYSKSKFILLTRDPRDNCLVKWRRAEKQNMKGYYPYYAVVWNYVYGMLYNKKLKIGKERFLDVKYEDLATHPEETLKKICDFLAIPYTDAMLEYDGHIKDKFKSNENNFSDTLKNSINLLHHGLMEKVNTKKVGFWKQNLKQDEADLIWHACSKTAQKFGYNAEGCSEKAKIDLIYILCYLKFCYIYIFRPNLFFGLPMGIVTLIKKIKYRNRYKTGKYTNEDFYTSRVNRPA